MNGIINAARQHHLICKYYSLFYCEDNNEEKQLRHEEVESIVLNNSMCKGEVQTQDDQQGHNLGSWAGDSSICRDGNPRRKQGRIWDQ